MCLSTQQQVVPLWIWRYLKFLGIHRICLSWHLTTKSTDSQNGSTSIIKCPTSTQTDQSNEYLNTKQSFEAKNTTTNITGIHCASKIPTMNWPGQPSLPPSLPPFTLGISPHPHCPGTPHPTSLRAGSFRAWSNHCRTNLSTWNDVTTRPPWWDPHRHPQAERCLQVVDKPLGGGSSWGT